MFVEENILLIYTKLYLLNGKSEISKQILKVFYPLVENGIKCKFFFSQYPF